MKNTNTIKTMKDWEGSFTDCFKEGDELDEELYYHMFSCMPPYYRKDYWVVSEPFDHDKNGRPVYMAFREISGHYFYYGLKH